MSTDKYKIDSHKLLYHLPRVNDWLAGEDVYPIYMELSPSGACNHRCTYCALDFMEYKRRYLDTDIIIERLKELGRLGLKSVMFAGEGEPLLHPDMAQINQAAYDADIDTAFTTNGVLLNPKIAPPLLATSQWIKISINGAKAETYAKIHRCQESDFQQTIDNLTAAVQIRKAHGYKCTLGMQLLLLPDNHHEAELLAQLAREIGMDYLVIKPYSQHPLSKTRIYENIKYSDFEYLEEKLQQYNTESFRVIYRSQSMRQWDDSGHTYQHCLALPFWSYIDTGGNVWGCSMFLGDDKFYYGNINEQAFAEIWHGEKRQKSLDMVHNHMDSSLCRVNCRMDKINQYLWELRHPPEHVNFI